MRALLLLVVLVSPSVFAQKVQATLDCRHTGTDFIYDCRITLQRGGEPLSGAQVTVGADMPSMPMAPNIRPDTAKPTSRTGEDQARRDLEMTG